MGLPTPCSPALLSRPALPPLSWLQIKGFSVPRGSACLWGPSGGERGGQGGGSLEEGPEDPLVSWVPVVCTSVGWAWGSGEKQVLAALPEVPGGLCRSDAHKLRFGWLCGWEEGSNTQEHRLWVVPCLGEGSDTQERRFGWSHGWGKGKGGRVSPRPRWGHVCRWGSPGPAGPHKLEAEVGVRGARPGQAGPGAQDKDGPTLGPRPGRLLVPHSGLAAHRCCPWGGDRVCRDLWPLLTLTPPFP